MQHALLFVTLPMVGTAIKSHPSNLDNLLEIESASLEFQSLLSISLYNPHKLSTALNWALSLRHGFPQVFYSGFEPHFYVKLDRDHHQFYNTR